MEEIKEGKLYLITGNTIFRDIEKIKLLKIKDDVVFYQRFGYMNKWGSMPLIHFVDNIIAKYEN